MQTRKSRVRTFHGIQGLVAAATIGCQGIEPLGSLDQAALATALDIHQAELDARAPADGDPDVAALAARCGDLNDESTAAPPLPASVPEPTEALPAACDEEARVAALVERCGPLVEVTGDTLAAAAAQCGSGMTCHVRLGAGDFEGGAVFGGCAFVEGEGDATRIHGTMLFGAPSVLARVAVDASYAAVEPMADLLVNEAALSAGYEGLGFSWDADIDVAVCRSRVSGGYSGVAVSWGSRRLVVAGSHVVACYEAVATSWGSEGLLVTQNVLAAQYAGVHVHRSLASAIVGNRIFGAAQAVDVYAEEPYCPEAETCDTDYEVQTVRVLVKNNIILGGSIPETNEALEIFVDGNMQE